MAWDLQRAGLTVRLQVDWRHPALRKIITLYLPIAAGLVVTLFQVGLDRRLASGISAESIAWMRYATTLQQLPLGLISVAISLAALPRLSQYFAARQEDEYRQTLGRGLRMVLLLIAPAAVALWLLAAPVTRIIFQHGQSSVQDTEQIVQALHIYLIGMFFAALDFPLNYAFYARNNTLLPAIVGVISVGVYMVTAFALLHRWGYLGLVWADTAKQASHALIMIVLLRWRVGPLAAQVGRGLLYVTVGASAMALTIFLLVQLVGIKNDATFWTDLLTVGLVGGAGFVVYIGVLALLPFAELRQLWLMFRRRLT
jgi:putative peptidoglycan lipid II flippase